MTSRTGVPAQTRDPSTVSGVQPVTRVPTGSRTGLANPATQRTVPTHIGTPPVARVPSGATGQPVTRQPSGMPASGLGTNQASGLASRTRAPTGNSGEVQSNASVAQTRVAQQSSVTPRGVTGTVPQRQPSTYERTPPTPGTDGSITPRTAGGSVAASRAVQRARRVSKVIVEKEKKTDYWQEIIQEARAESPDLSQDDVNAMVARCLSLDLVSNWKAREEQGTAPKARELFQQLEVSMDRKLTELNGGVPLRVPGTGFQKIKALERQLQILETKADKAQDDEAEKVKAKITELSNTLATVQKKKEAEREQNRRTMTMEISNLREQMQKAATEPAGGQDSAKLIEENKKMAQKMARLESALRQMNDERKKGVEDNDTAMLKKKLTLFESRMKQLEEEKKLKETEEHTDTMRDKLLLMEEKLAKMERRKSVSITMMMQQKMQQVEEELSRLKSGGGGGSQVADLEKKLVEMQNTKVNPSMINDPETRALRSHIKKMEDAMLAAEKKMENDRLRLEEEREQQVIKRQREEEAYRKKAQQREQLLLEKMAEMEKRIASASRGGGPPPPPGARGGGGMDQALQKKMEELEAKMSGGAFAEQMAAMEKRIKDTEERLAKEQQTTNLLHGILNRDGSDDPNMKDAQIANLTAATQDLMAKLEAQAKAMDDRFNAVTTKIETMSFAGPATHVHKSGLSYADINAKLEEIQKKLFDPDIEERESEQLNIEYEKLISELESTAEYKAEQDAAAKKWKEENTPLNNAALAKLKQEIGSWTPMKKTAQFKRKPELKFLEFTPDQINKKHVNDFKGVTTQNLTLEEARALFACMPEFRKDQEAQLQFHEQLKNKIETEAKKPAVKAPPPIKATKAVVFKRPPVGGDGGSPDFLAELMKKRKQVG